MMRRLGLALGLLIFAAGWWLPERALLGRAIARAAPPVAPAPSIGQWIWTRADAESFARARLLHPELVPAIRIASIENRPRAGAASELVLRRGLSPSVAGTPRAALVVRIENSVHTESLPPASAERAALASAFERSSARWLALGVYAGFLDKNPKHAAAKSALAEADRVYNKLINYGGGDYYFWGETAPASRTARELRRIGKIVRHP